MWLPLNPRLAKTLRAAAAEVDQTTVTDLAGVVADLVDHPSRRALTARRDMDFHRWRPQSVAGGTATTNPWKTIEGGLSLSGGGPTGHQPPDPRALVQEVTAGLQVLAETMSGWLDIWPAALRDLGMPVFTTT